MEDIIDQSCNLEDELMKKDLIIDYFMIIGLEEQYYTKENLNNLKMLKKVHPSIISKFPSNRIKYPFNENTINKFILKNIFPLKEIDFIKDPSLKGNKSSEDSIFKEYIIESNEKPKNFFHIFSVPNQSKGSLYEAYKHFGCLIIFEDVTELASVNSLKRKIFIAKALVITSIYPYYSTFKLILENISIKINTNCSYPIEILIYNLILLLEKPLKKKVNFSLFHYPLIKIKPESLLPICDLNIFKFFSLFSLEDFFIMAERQLYLGYIYFFSEDLSLLYPTCLTFLTLLFPLNFSGNYYYPKLISEGSIYKSLFFDSCFPMILLFYGKYNDEFMMNNLQFHGKSESILIVDIDRRKIEEICYENNKYFIIKGKQLEIKQKIPKFKHYNEDTYQEITNSFSNYNNSNKNITYFDMLPSDTLKASIYIRQNLFYFFIKIINFYINCVTFSYEGKKNMEIFSNFNKKLFMDFAIKQFPNKEIFYEKFYSENVPFRDMISKKTDLKLDERDIKNFMLMEELVRLSHNKDIIYFDTQNFQTNNEETNKVIINDELFERHMKKYKIDDNLIKTLNNFQRTILLENNKIVFHYHYIPKLILNEFYNINNRNSINFISKTMIGKNNYSSYQISDFLMYELNIISLLIEQCLLDLSFDETIIFSFILILSIQINSIFDNKVKIRKISIILRILKKNHIKVNFIYSMVYDLIVRHNLDFEKQFISLIVEKKLNPSLYIFLLKKNQHNLVNIYDESCYTSIQISKKETVKNINFELVHECEYSNKYSKNLYEYFIKCTYYNSLVYFDCHCKVTDISFKSSYNSETYPLMGGPITCLRMLIMIVLSSDSLFFELTNFNSKHLHYLQTIGFYSSLIKLDVDEIFRIN